MHLNHASSLTAAAQTVTSGRAAQFSLRRLLSLVLIVAFLCGLIALNAARGRQQRAAAAEIVQLGGRIVYDYQLQSKRVRVDRQSVLPDWLLATTGEDFFHSVVYVDLGAPHVDDSALRHLTSFPNLRWLELSLSSVSDDGLEQVGQLHRLERLGLKGTRVTDRGLRHLFGLKRLDCIYLDATAVTPKGVDRLEEELPSCRVETGGPLVTSRR